MKKQALAFLIVLCAVPAASQTIYSSGPTNGNWYAWTINFGFIVSDTFTVSVPLDYAEVTGATFAMWLIPGDTLESAELSITSQENGGISYLDQTVNFTQGACTINRYGYNVCQENTSFNGTGLDNGTFWINLQNAVTNTGDPVYWDQNLGPHTNLNSASENTVGTIPAETFTLTGYYGFQNGTQQSTVPEPGSILLFASGAVGLAESLRRRVSR